MITASRIPSVLDDSLECIIQHVNPLLQQVACKCFEVRVEYLKALHSSALHVFGANVSAVYFEQQCILHVVLPLCIHYQVSRWVRSLRDRSHTARFAESPLHII